jgi:hypothetical protein
VYKVVCDMITAVGVGGYCIPGNVKQSRRIIFKTLFSYGGLLSKCRDLSRLTIKVPNLTVMAELIAALHAHQMLQVIRCKNRYDPAAKTAEAGGYRVRRLLGFNIWNCMPLFYILARMPNVGSHTCCLASSQHVCDPLKYLVGTSIR